MRRPGAMPYGLRMSGPPTEIHAADRVPAPTLPRAGSLPVAPPWEADREELMARVVAVVRIRWLMAGVAFVYAAMVAVLDRQLGLRLGLPWPFFVAVLPLAIVGYNALVLATLRRNGDI